MSNKKIALAYPPGLFFSLSLSSRAMSFDPMLKPIVEAIRTSQSLWNRAGSFDRLSIWFRPSTSVSIPLEQGGVFRLWKVLDSLRHFTCLNPFGTGRGLSTNDVFLNLIVPFRLNPFGTGRGLSTLKNIKFDRTLRLNPFGTGRGLSTF